MVGDAKGNPNAERFYPDSAPNTEPGSKIYFHVPFEKKEIAKDAGLKWDSSARRWYAANAQIANAFSTSAEVHINSPASASRFYFQVPFLQKDRAKAIGMRFDGIRKLWFAPDQALAVDAARVFERIP